MWRISSPTWIRPWPRFEWRVKKVLFRSSFVPFHLSLLLFAVAARAEDPYELLRETFLQKINASRQKSALAPLRLSPSLSRLAQQRAQEIAAGGSRSDQVAAQEDAHAAARSGYEARFLAEVDVQADGDIDRVFANATQPGGLFEEEIRRRDSRDLGLGVATRDEVPLYVFLFGLSWEDFIAGRRAELSDLSRVRRHLLERVNRERGKAGLLPLREEPLLDSTAQRHANDMLARSYYGHESPEGTTVLQRSKAVGYRPRFVAENIARGPDTAEEVMNGWMGSPTHRANILGSFVSDLGAGVAFGKNASGYQIIWVQCFGLPREKREAPDSRGPRSVSE
jgi:uncharacterized protein YkwD